MFPSCIRCLIKHRVKLLLFLSAFLFFSLITLRFFCFFAKYQTVIRYVWKKNEKAQMLQQIEELNEKLEENEWKFLEMSQVSQRYYFYDEKLRRHDRFMKNGSRFGSASNINCKLRKSQSHQAGILLIVVLTTADNVSRRNEIRRSWSSRQILNNTTLKLIFVTGSGELDQESAHFKDILQLDISDSSYNETLKIRLLFQWILDNCSTKFSDHKLGVLVLPATSDFSVSSPGSKLTPKLTNSSILCAKIDRNRKPNRNVIIPNYVSYREWNHAVAPTHCRGGFALSLNLIKQLFHISTNHRYVRDWELFYSGILPYEIMRDIGKVIVHKRISCETEMESGLATEMPLNTEAVRTEKPERK